MKDKKAAEKKKREDAEKRKNKRELKEKKRKSEANKMKLKLGGKVNIGAKMGFWGRLYNQIVKGDQGRVNGNLSYK